MNNKEDLIHKLIIHDHIPPNPIWSDISDDDLIDILTVAIQTGYLNKFNDNFSFIAKNKLLTNTYIDSLQYFSHYPLIKLKPEPDSLRYKSYAIFKVKNKKYMDVHFIGNYDIILMLTGHYLLNDDIEPIRIAYNNIKDKEDYATIVYIMGLSVNKEIILDDFISVNMYDSNILRIFYENTNNKFMEEGLKKLSFTTGYSMSEFEGVSHLKTGYNRKIDNEILKLSRLNRTIYAHDLDKLLTLAKKPKYGEKYIRDIIRNKHNKNYLLRKLNEFKSSAERHNNYDLVVSINNMISALNKGIINLNSNIDAIKDSIHFKYPNLVFEVKRLMRLERHMNYINSLTGWLSILDPSVYSIYHKKFEGRPSNYLNELRLQYTYLLKAYNIRSPLTFNNSFDVRLMLDLYWLPKLVENIYKHDIPYKRVCELLANDFYMNLDSLYSNLFIVDTSYLEKLIKGNTGEDKVLKKTKDIAINIIRVFRAQNQG
jgi:hypothetical protein